MNATTTSKPASSWLDDRERFNQLAAILIALVTLLTAGVALLQNDAGARDDRANRQAQQAAVQQMGQHISGEIRVNYDQNDAFRTWDELDTLALAAYNNDDDAAGDRYRGVQEEIDDLSALLAPPYFDPAEGGYPDTARYESDTYLVQVTTLAERFQARFETKLAWDEKANTYILHLTILAVALFLFGLATTVESRVHWIFLGTGGLITVVALVWVLIVFVRPVPDLPDAAIDAYAQGVGLAHQDRYEEAIDAFDQALAIAPEYANALYDRGLAYTSLGDYESAVADYTAAQRIKKSDANVAWDLGWNYYLLGRFGESATALRRALELKPDLVGVRFDLALALLASGQLDAARAEYTQAMDMAAQQVAAAHTAGEQPPASLWTYMDWGAAGLVDLLDQLSDEPPQWTEAPPVEAIGDPDAVRAAALDLMYEVKSLAVALEFTGQPPAGEAQGSVSTFEFGQYTWDEEGNVLDEYELTDVFPFGTDEVLVLFDYEGMQDGRNEIWKVYVDGEEDPSWRVDAEWELGTSGGAEKALSYAYSDVYVLSPGEYTIELYVDHRLLQTGRFYIESEEE